MTSKHLQLSMEEYLAHPALGRSDLRVIGMDSPKAWRWQREQAAPRRSDAMDFGTAVHLAILEPDEVPHFVHRYDGVRRGKKWEEFAAQLPEGSIVLKPEAKRRMEQIALAVRTEPELLTLLNTGVVENTITFQEPESGVHLKTRPDFWAQDRQYVVDIKTTRSLDDSKLTRSSYDLAYDLQAAMWEQASKGLDDCPPILATYHLWISTTGPIEFRITEHDEGFKAQGAGRLRAWSKLYRDCVRLDTWPGRNMRIETLELPNYLLEDYSNDH